jgi:hypothetical protein
MNQKAVILFQIALQHTFFKDGLAKGIQCTPTASGRRQLSSIRGHYTPCHGGGVAVFPAPQNDKEGKTAPIPPDLNTVLLLELTEADFINYTDLDDTGPGQIWYANSVTNRNPLPLKRLDLKGPQFRADFSQKMPEGADAQRRVQIVRPNGEVILDKTYYTSPRESSYDVDLRAATDGAYELRYTVAGKTLKQAFFKWDQGLPRAVFGMFEWFATQKVKGNVREPLGQQFVFQFNARQTFWQYYLVKKNGISLRNPSIAPVKVGDRTVSFSQTNADVVLPNGRHAMEFTSDQELPLQEIPRLEIMLEASGLAKGMLLPYAAPDLLYAAKSATKRSSKIYVYF